MLEIPRIADEVTPRWSSLKCLCQTEEEKAVAWHSDAWSLERQGIPREFTTKSRVVIMGY
jgi:hypothetical protein